MFFPLPSKHKATVWADDLTRSHAYGRINECANGGKSYNQDVPSIENIGKLFICSSVVKCIQSNKLKKIYNLHTHTQPEYFIIRRHKYTYVGTHIYWYIDTHHLHHVVLVARISLTLSRHFSLSFIASDRSSGQHPVSSHNCWMYVHAGRLAFARPCVGVYQSTSRMSSSLLLQQCPACLVRLTWIVFVIGGRWPYSWCLVGCCRQDLFKIARSILV